MVGQYNNKTKNAIKWKFHVYYRVQIAQDSRCSPSVITFCLSPCFALVSKESADVSSYESYLEWLCPFRSIRALSFTEEIFANCFGVTESNAAMAYTAIADRPKDPPNPYELLQDFCRRASTSGEGEKPLETRDSAGGKGGRRRKGAPGIGQAILPFGRRPWGLRSHSVRGIFSLSCTALSDNFLPIIAPCPTLVVFVSASFPHKVHTMVEKCLPLESP